MACDFDQVLLSATKSWPQCLWLLLGGHLSSVYILASLTDSRIKGRNLAKRKRAHLGPFS